MTAFESSPQHWALRILPLIDLTNLNEACGPEDIDQLTDAATMECGHVAALCVWPRFVKRTVARLADAPDIAVATVVNFPAGGEDIEPVVAQTELALADGANEIDLVWPYRSFCQGHHDIAQTMISTIHAAISGRAMLKVILETGKLGDAPTIGRASRLALEAGADFLKTSTGKTNIGATLPAARAMLEAIREFDRPAGFKASGGISTVEQAAEYLQCADDIMGPDWVSPQTFRFGASSLLAAVRKAINVEQERG